VSFGTVFSVGEKEEVKQGKNSPLRTKSEKSSGLKGWGFLQPLRRGAWDFRSLVIGKQRENGLDTGGSRRQIFLTERQKVESRAFPDGEKIRAVEIVFLVIKGEKKRTGR